MDDDDNDNDADDDDVGDSGRGSIFGPRSSRPRR